MLRTKVNFMWQHRVNDYKSSGQTISIWCKENDVKPARLRAWIRAFSSDHTSTKEVSNWVSVDTTELKAAIK
jgi:transposase-like protein